MHTDICPLKIETDKQDCIIRWSQNRGFKNLSDLRYNLVTYGVHSALPPSGTVINLWNKKYQKKLHLKDSPSSTIDITRGQTCGFHLVYHTLGTYLDCGFEVNVRN